VTGVRRRILALSALALTCFALDARAQSAAAVGLGFAHALAVADLALLCAAARVVVTPSADVVGAGDSASPEEIDATRKAFEEHGCEITWEETLAGAMREMTRASSPDDLVVLIGAQGMDDGARLLREMVDSAG
jgi:hypothetical protein